LPAVKEALHAVTVMVVSWFFRRILAKSNPVLNVAICASEITLPSFAKDALVRPSRLWCVSAPARSLFKGSTSGCRGIGAASNRKSIKPLESD
jgi:hypothetical protein